MNGTARALALTCGLCGWALAGAEGTRLDGTGDVYLTLAHAQRSSCGWGQARDGASVTGMPLQVGTALFARGIGTHAPAELVFAPGGKYRWLTFHAGISADMTAAGSATVEVWLDGKKVHQTPVLRIGAEPVYVQVPLAGVKSLRIVGTDAGDDNGADHVNLGHLRLCAGPEQPKPDAPRRAPRRIRPAAPARRAPMPRTRPIDPRHVPTRGAASTRPAADWTEAMLTGNGTMGAMLFGGPHDETLVLNHCLLYLPTGSREIVPDLAKFAAEFKAAGLQAGMKGPAVVHDLMRARADKRIVNTDPFHPAFLLRLKLTGPHGQPKNYLMTEDFATGELAVRWTDDLGQWERKVFASRPDNVVVMSMTGPKGKLDCELGLDISSPLVRPQIEASEGWLSARTVYVKGKGGYDSVLRVVAEGGKVAGKEGVVTVSGAEGLLVLIRVQPWRTPLPAEQSEAWAFSPKHPDFAPGHKTEWLADLRTSLAKLPANYAALLAPHARVHGEMFSRASLDLGGGKDRKELSEVLMDRAAKEDRMPPALTERMYDACRYLTICSAGQRPPNLQGIWTGTWQPAWSGDYTLDSNLQLEIQSMLSANLPELMASYFDLVESWLPDWRVNARKLYGCRGVVSNARASNVCLLLHWGRWPGEQFLGGAGWLAHFFHEYYVFTGDKDFLRKRLVPMLKEIALFYEDLLAGTEGADGKYRFYISYSPEQALIANATFDVAVARETLGNLISACELLKIEADNVPKWKRMLAKLPPYLVDSSGGLKEWSWPGAGEHPNHRHHSQFYPLYQSWQFDPAETPTLWEACKVALAAKTKHWFHAANSDSNHITHGMANHAQCAARLGLGEIVGETLARMATRRYLLPSFMISYWPDRKGFGFDPVGTIPDVVNNALVFSRKGVLDLLPALPSAWPKGAVRGILARGRIKVDHLAWDRPGGSVDLDLTSGVAQTLTLRLPAWARITSAEVVEGNATIAPPPANTPNERKLTLPAGSAVRVRIRFGR